MGSGGTRFQPRIGLRQRRVEARPAGRGLLSDARCAARTNFFERFVSWLTTVRPPSHNLMIMQCADPWNDDVETVPSRSCGECGRDMTLAVALPRLGALPALRSYRCTMCGNVELDVLEHFGPRPFGATMRPPRS